MASSARALLTDLPKGHEFPATTFTFTRDDVAAYLAAVEDANGLYLERGLSPPLAVAARGLGALLEVMELPDGTLHTGQEVESHTAVPIGSELRLTGRIAQKSQRAGVIISIIEFQLALGTGEPAITGKTMVMTATGDAG